MNKVKVGIFAAMMMAGTVLADNLYQNHSYIHIVPPSHIGVTMTGPTTTAVVVSTPSASNATGVCVNSYPGTGVLLLHVDCGGASSPAGAITWTSYSTTNIGTAASYTNGTWVASSKQYTNSMSFTGVTNIALPFVSNYELGWIEEQFVATGVTNGNVSAVLITPSR